MNSLFFLLIIPFVLVLLFFSQKNKKKRKEQETRTNNDEVWSTIKRHLKSNGETGKEIIDSFVARRQNKELKKRDIYVVLFTTRDSRTFTKDEPRAIEVEIISKKVDRKRFDRSIRINGEKDYAVENVWITKSRKKELKRQAKIDERAKKKAEAKQLKTQSKINKQAAQKNLKPVVSTTTPDALNQPSEEI